MRNSSGNPIIFRSLFRQVHKRRRNGNLWAARRGEKIVSFFTHNFASMVNSNLSRILLGCCVVSPETGSATHSRCKFMSGNLLFQLQDWESKMEAEKKKTNASLPFCRERSFSLFIPRNKFLIDFASSAMVSVAEIDWEVIRVTWTSFTLHMDNRVL